MRSKYHRGGSSTPPRGNRRPDQVLVPLVLLVAGAAVALSAPWIVTNAAAPSAAAPVLEAETPHAVTGTSLTVESATDATSLRSAPSNRALDAALIELGKTASDLQIAEA